MPNLDARPRSFTHDSRLTRALACGGIVLVAWLAYHNSFSVPFLFDDEESIDANPTIKRLSAITEVLTPPANGSGVTGRPLVNLSLALNHAIGGTAVQGYHGLNLLVHTLAGLTLFGLLRRTFAQPMLRDRLGAHPLPLAGVVAALWTVHPLQTESVVCVIQRTELLVGLFYLLTLYGFVRSAEEPASRLWPAITVGACLLGMASKEVMVSAPLMVLLYDRTFFAATFAEAWRRRRGLYVGLAATWLLLGWLVISMGGTRGPVAGLGLGVSPFDYAIKQCDAIARYLWLSLWPNPLVLDYGESLAVHPIGVWLQGLVIVALAAATILAVRRGHPLGVAGAWFFAILAPSSSVVPLLTQTVAEHRMYLPLAGVIATAVVALAAITSARSRVFAAAGAVVALAFVTACRNADYHTGLGIWQDTVTKAPHNSRAHHNLGVELAKLGRTQEAIASFERSLECKPTDIAAHYSLAFLVAQAPGGRDRAITHYEQALRINQNHINARIRLAAELARERERLPEALAHYELALRLKPDNRFALNNLATELVAIPGRLPEAIALYQRALTLKPDDPELHFNYANALRHAPARRAEAFAHYARALQLNPKFFEARYTLANELATEPARAVEAIAHYLAALELRPDHALLHFNLGVVYANHGRTGEAIRQFETVLRLNPQSTDAQRALQLLRSQ